MAQAKRRTANRTRKTTQKRATGSRANTGMRRKQQMQKQQGSNMFFVISMTALAATLLFANILMIAG